MSSPSIDQDCYWQEFTQLKLAACYVRDYRNHIGRRETLVATVRAVASSASIATWAIWRRYAFVWAGIIVASQVVDALRDVFPFGKKRRSLSRWSNSLNRLFVDAQRDWENIAAGKLTNAKIRSLTHQLRQKMQRYEQTYAPNGLKRKDNLFEAAQAEMAQFFASRYPSQ
jgi:hypothetical protein